MNTDFFIIGTIFMCAVIYFGYYMYNSIKKTKETGSCSKCIDNRHYKKIKSI